MNRIEIEKRFDAIVGHHGNRRIEKVYKTVLTMPEGFTLKLPWGLKAVTGYAVAPNKATETRVNNLTAKDIYEFVTKWADALSDKRAYLGGWYDTATKQHVLDVSFVVADRADALAIAVKGSQDAIFHLDTMQEIRVR